MFVLKFILKPIPLATLFIFGLVAVGPNAALAKKVKGKGTVEILAASGKNEPAKKKTSTPADLGPGGLTAKCKAKFEEFEDWDEAFKAFALGKSEDKMACTFSEGDSDAIDSCNDELRGAGIYNTHCVLYAKASGGKVVVLRKMDTEHTQSKKSAPKADAEITAEVKKRALEKAKLSAWHSYVKKTFSEARQRDYLDLKQKTIERLDDFIVELVPLDSWADEDAGTYTVMVRAEIDDGAVEAYFLSHSRAATQETGEGNDILVIFQARKLKLMTSYKKRTTDIKAEEGTQSTKETAAAKGGTVVSGTTTKSMSVKESGGSTSRRSSDREYKIIPAKHVGTTMKGVLDDSGFLSWSYGEFAHECGAPHPKEIEKSYINGEEIPFELWAEIYAGAKECDVKFIAVGTLDIDAPNTDPSRGNIVVTTRAIAEVKMRKKRGKRVRFVGVANVGPIQFKGWGDDEIIAETNSLRQAAKKVASEIRDKLNQKRLR